MFKQMLVAVAASMVSLSMPSAAKPIGTAHVTAALSPDGVNAAIVLPTAVKTLKFRKADVVRDGEFEVLTPGVSLSGDTIASVRPFRRVDIRVRPMKQERDAKYPAHFRVGSGGVVYTPALQLDPASWTTDLRFVAAPGEVKLPAGSAEDGFVFIGPKSLVREQPNALVIASPNVPQWLLQNAESALGSAVDHFTKALGMSLPRKPLMIVTHDEAPTLSSVADVVPGGTTALRFHGTQWRKRDEGIAKSMRRLIHHEAFHFWNGGLASFAEGTPTWLHEGGAEYAALLSAHSTGALSADEVGWHLSDSLTRCRSALGRHGDKTLSEIQFLSAEVRYPCGMAIQWAADLRLRQSSHGKRTVLDAWRRTIDVARKRPDRSYTLQDFYGAADIRGSADLRPLALLTEQSGGQRWAELAGSYNKLGAEVSLAATHQGRRQELLFHLLRQNCRDLPEGANIGFNSAPGGIKLDTPKGCGALTGEPVVDRVEGGDISKMTAATYQAVQLKCARSLPVTFTKADGSTISALCAAPLPPAPKDFVTERWLPAGQASGG